MRRKSRGTAPLHLFLALLIASSAAAQSAGPSANTINGFDRDRLARIDSVLQRYVDEGRVAGAVGLVMRDGQIVYEGAAGWLDREAGRPMTTDAIFRIASQSKAIISTAIMMLVEQGKMNLNEPITRWMPTFADSRIAVRGDDGPVEMIPARRAITPRDLLTHTAGISYGGEQTVSQLYIAQNLGGATGYGWYTADKNETICESMDRLGSLPKVQQPGTTWVYGYNTDILGCIVERVSGLPLDEFLRQRLTGPLGMNDTDFFLPPEKRERLAAVYTVDSSTGQVVRAPDGPRGQGDYVDGPRRNFSGGAGLLSTARDYARFLETIRNGGALDGVRILAPHTTGLMTTNQIGDVRNADGLGFGLGFETVERLGASNFASEGTFGWSGAYGTLYKVDPRERMVMVLMIQVVPYFGSGIRESFDAAVYHALVEPEQDLP
jgi:CubicO group peptidase (beta-lactamase class C family)